MLCPGYEVRNSRKQVIAAAGDRSLRFGIIGSHGLEYMRSDPAR